MESDPETVRRILRSVLDRLDERSNTGAEGADPPVILVVMSDSTSATNHSQDQQEAHNEAAGRREYFRGTVEGHPGLERFQISETDSKLPAPKMCFMEPNRACVHSGACEMRGY